MLGMAVGSIGAGGRSKKAELDAAAPRLHALPGAGPPQARRAAAQQRAALLWRHPAPDALWSICARRGGCGSGAATDDDFGEVRIAVGRAAARGRDRAAGDQAGRGPRADDRDRAAPVRPDPLGGARPADRRQLRAFSRVVLRGEREPVAGPGPGRCLASSPPSTPRTTCAIAVVAAAGAGGRVGLGQVAAARPARPARRRGRAGPAGVRAR